MSPSVLNCQLGFGYHDEPESIYYHERDGEAVTFRITLPDEAELLDPFTVDDLVAAEVIDYSLLPKSIQLLIEVLAESAFTIIQAENPSESAKLNPMDIEASFHRRNGLPLLN